jgi:hypothetical protein
MSSNSRHIKGQAARISTRNVRALPLADVLRFGRCRGRVMHVTTRSANPDADAVLVPECRRADDICVDLPLPR